jgi:hypothetical protein
LTGDFDIEMVTFQARTREALVSRNAVMGEPSLPFVGDGLHVTPEELARLQQRVAIGLEVRAYRYATDTTCKARLFLKLQEELGPGFKGTTLPAAEKLQS